jgi:ketosteroid isomerase-like protein
VSHHRRTLIGAALAVVAAAGLTAGFTSRSQSPDVNAIVRQFHVNYSNNEVEKNGDLVDQDIVVNLNGGEANRVNGQTFRGREAFVAWLQRDKQMFADGRITDHEVLVSGNKAAIRFTLEGTHTGPIVTPGGTLPATNRKVRIEGTEFFEFNDQGKLIHLETLTNDLGAVGQLTGPQ